jgi:hypothetical protein
VRKRVIDIQVKNLNCAQTSCTAQTSRRFLGKNFECAQTSCSGTRTLRSPLKIFLYVPNCELNSLPVIMLAVYCYTKNKILIKTFNVIDTRARVTNNKKKKIITNSGIIISFELIIIIIETNSNYL